MASAAGICRECRCTDNPLGANGHPARAAERPSWPSCGRPAQLSLFLPLRQKLTLRDRTIADFPAVSR